MSAINQIFFDYAAAEKQAAQLDELAEKGKAIMPKPFCRRAARSRIR